MKVDVSLGDVVDRITILRLKLQHLRDEGRRANVERELRMLVGAWHDGELPRLEGLPWWHDLCDVNAQLWDVEDALRRHEANQDFGDEFVRRARSVYRLNDRRAALKRNINEHLGSSLLEEKVYERYDGLDVDEIV